jgi:hypothetical protein
LNAARTVAVTTLVELQDHYRDWLDNVTASIESSRLAEKLQVFVELDLELRAVEPPRRLSWLLHGSPDGVSCDTARDGDDHTLTPGAIQGPVSRRRKPPEQRTRRYAVSFSRPTFAGPMDAASP